MVNDDQVSEEEVAAEDALPVFNEVDPVAVGRQSSQKADGRRPGSAKGLLRIVTEDDEHLDAF